jgi:hypothetical protein
VNELEHNNLVAAALDAAMAVLKTADCELNGAILIAELDGKGVTLVIDDSTDVASVPAMLAEASFRAAGADWKWS